MTPTQTVNRTRRFVASSAMAFERIAAERAWFAVAPDGTEHEVVLRVGLPTRAPGGEWRVAVTLGVLESRVHDIAGIDAWQAITLGMRFAATRVGHFADDGWCFYWERGGDPASPKELARAPQPL